MSGTRIGIMQNTKTKEFKIFQTTKYDAQEMHYFREGEYKLITSAWASGYGDQKYGAFNLYRQIRRKHGDVFTYKTVQTVIDMIKSKSTEWRAGRANYQDSLTNTGNVTI
jgi:hypothetical protein